MRHTTRELSRDTVTDGSGQRARAPRKFELAGLRGRTIGIAVLAAMLAAGGVATVRLLGENQGVSGASAMNTPTGGVPAGSQGGSGTASVGMPQVAAPPRLAAMPTRAARTRSAPSPTRMATTARPTPAYSGSAQPSTSGSASPAPTSTAAGSAACRHPQFQTSDPSGMWNLAPYFLMNDMWASSNYHVTQTLYGCSYSNWYVVATMDNSNGDGAVKSYPNSHRDFDNAPAINSFSSITSTFAETSPGTGIYEDAYDIWLNGIATSGSTEVMIWTDNHGQTPSGSAQASVTIGGRTYTVWKTTGNYIAFVADSNFSSATMNLLDFFKWLMSKGWLANNATLGQVDYGAELVSTNGVPATFTFSNFSVNARLRAYPLTPA